MSFSGRQRPSDRWPRPNAHGLKSICLLLILLIASKFLRCCVLVEIQIQCPHCGEIITSNADTSQGDYATIEDCEVCCRPMNVEVICEPGRVEEVRVSLA